MALILHNAVMRNQYNHIFKHLTHGLALRKLINRSCSYLNQQIVISLSGEHLAAYAVRFQPRAVHTRSGEETAAYTFPGAS